VRRAAVRVLSHQTPSSFGQFERTLIICEDDSFCHYVEGCSAPVYTTNSLHSAVVEIFVKDRARVPIHDDPELGRPTFTNLVTKRAFLYKNSVMEWVDGNLGSKRTVKYPSCYMLGEGGHGEILSPGQFRQGNVAGRGRQAGVLRTELHGTHQLEIDQRPWWACFVPRAGAGQRGGQELPGTGQLRRAHSR